MRSAIFEDILNRLKSRDENDRKRAWQLVAAARATSHDALTADQYEKLLEVLRSEMESRVIREGYFALIASAPFVSSPEDGTATSKPSNLSDWLWKPFHNPSFVFGLSDRYYRRRDEDALIYLARCLSQSEYPNADFQSIWMNEPDLEPVLSAHPFYAMCFVGRRHLFGTQVLEELACPSPRFDFPNVPRPEMEPGEIRKGYHLIVEHCRKGPLKLHETEEYTNGKGTVRIDFALVQRYMVHTHGRWTVVVNIAGATGLGTLAAAVWATHGLRQPINGSGELMPLPSGLSYDSRIEALIKVKGDVTPMRWEPYQIELLHLSVDRAAWNPHEESWEIEPPGEITLVYEKADSREPVEMLFDGEPAPVKSNAESFRILARLCQAALEKSGKGCEIAKLATDPWVVQDSESERNAARIRRQVRTVGNRYLGRALDTNATRAGLDTQITKVRKAIK